VGPDVIVELAKETARRVFALEPGVDLAGACAGVDLAGAPRAGGELSRAPCRQLQEMFDHTVSTLDRFPSRGYQAAIRVFDDGERYFQPQAVPILSEDRTLIGVTLVLTDVTDLRRLDETKSGLISVVSHELKTPLTSIRMATHLLLEGNAGPLTQRQA